MSLVAAIQMASGPDVGLNLGEAERLIARAAADGARLVVLPENFAVMGMTEDDKVGVAEQEGEGEIQRFLAAQSRRHGLWLVGGTIPMVSEAPGKVYAACLVYDDQGVSVARYDKIHLFDVYIERSRERYEESRTIVPGDAVMVVDSPFGRLGIAICYDLRFPEIFRAMLDRGVELVAVPAAFTAATGKAHWEILVRARAVENQCYVVAAAQSGRHRNGRDTYGDSMVVDPWGTVLRRLAAGPGVVSAKISQTRLREIRKTFPVIDHRRLRG